MKTGVCNLETGSSPRLVLQRWCWAHSDFSMSLSPKSSPSQREGSSMVLLVARGEGVLQDLSKTPLPTYPHGSGNLILQAGWMSWFSVLQKRLAPSLPSQERAKRSGNPSALCTVAINMSHKPATGTLLPPITRQNCIGGEVVGFPRNNLCCTGNAWTGRKPAPLRNGTVQSYQWNTGNNSVHLQILYNIIVFFACVCGTAILSLFHFWALQRLSSSSCFRWYLR